MRTDINELTMPTLDSVDTFMRGFTARVHINSAPLRFIEYIGITDERMRISFTTAPHMATVVHPGGTYTWARPNLADCGHLFRCAWSTPVDLDYLAAENRADRAFRWDGDLFRTTVREALGRRYTGKLKAWVDKYVLAHADDEYRAKQAADTFEFEALANPLRDLVDNLGNTGCYSLSPAYAWAVYYGRYAMRALDT